MIDTASIAVWDVLKEFGFAPDSSVISEVTPGLSFDFGSFKLSAGVGLGKYLQPVVLFTGILATPRTLADICFEVPHMVISQEQLAAFLVYYLNNAADRYSFLPSQNIDWLTMGQQHRHLLPWEVDSCLQCPTALQLETRLASVGSEKSYGNRGHSRHCRRSIWL
ncbi:MAG: hypothetical protein IPG06_08110 [Haliea sp.]|nr:hypothetical protein [Haliea sp.]